MPCRPCGPEGETLEHPLLREPKSKEGSKEDRPSWSSPRTAAYAGGYNGNVLRALPTIPSRTWKAHGDRPELYVSGVEKRTANAQVPPPHGSAACVHNHRRQPEICYRD